MSTFMLEILTPERQFYKGEVEAVTITSSNGLLSVLKDHAPMVAPLSIGAIKIKKDGEWQEAFNSEGFLEVTGGQVTVFSQACEWPYEINIKRAEEAAKRAEEKIRQKRSNTEYKNAQISFARALARLKVTGSRNK